MFKKYILFLMSLFVWISGQLTAQDYEFILYSFPPAVPLDWSSPSKLAYGAGLKGRLVFEHGKNKHTIGHAFIELRKDGKRVELTGMTTAPDAPADADLVIKHGYGLGILIAPMKGILDGSNKLNGELEYRYKKTGKVMFIRFLINEHAYNRMKQYLDEYRAKGFDKIYNGTNEPRKGKGAGCSAFAMSFLDVCGYIDPEFTRQWVRRVNLPISLVGGPITGNRVSLLNLLVKKVFGEIRWAKPGENCIPLELWDPQLMYEWMQKVHQEGSKMNVLGRSFKFDQRGKATGIIVDITDLASVGDTIWR